MEGEKLDADHVRSSVARRLGMDIRRLEAGPPRPRCAILVTAPTLPDGSYRIGIPTTELECTALKDGARPAGVFLSRPAPDDDTLPARISAQIVRKMKKLRRYKDDGHTTVLILETEDVALMNQYKMLEAVRTAVGGQMPEGLDQVWFTEARGHVFFDFTGPITTGSDVLG